MAQGLQINEDKTWRRRHTIVLTLHLVFFVLTLIPFGYSWIEPSGDAGTVLIMILVYFVGLPWLFMYVARWCQWFSPVFRFWFQLVLVFINVVCIIALLIV